MRFRKVMFAAAAAVVIAASVSSSAYANQTEELLTLRNTIVGMLEQMVLDGVLTAEQAQTLVDKAEQEAYTEYEALQAQDAVTEDTVRVTYVPEVVRDELKQELREELKQEVTQAVLDDAKEEAWGVPGALPAWIYDISFNADVRLRGEYVQFDDENPTGVYRNFQAINEAGGFNAAGQQALLNVTEKQDRMRARLRVGGNVALNDNWSAGVRVASGNEGVPVTRNVGLGQTFNSWDVGVDLAYIHYASRHFLFTGGRFNNPFVRSDLIFDQDLTFEGVTMTGVLPHQYRQCRVQTIPYRGRLPAAGH